MQKRKKIYLDSLGCPKNLVDSELILYHLTRQKKFTKVDSPRKADVIMVNTCGFIDKAKEESINTILEYSRFKNKEIVVIGCLVNRYKNILKRSIPEVKHYLTTTEALKQFADSSHIQKIDFSKRFVTTPLSYAYVKIAEGCSRRCAYCMIPLIRGEFVSRKSDSILKEINFLAQLGIKEIILVAHDLLSYGTETGENLIDLLEKIESIEKIYRIRLLYLYPEERLFPLIRSIKGLKKTCPYIEMPLQHVSRDILSRMQRPLHDYEKWIDRIRSLMPEAALRTTFILGFPGETRDHFNQLKRFIRKIKFNWAGFYEYSDEDGTRAYRLSDKVSDNEVSKRMNEVVQAQKEITSLWLSKRIDQTYHVLVDEIVKEEGIAFTRSELESPDIDGHIIMNIHNDRVQVGDLLRVRITESYDYDLQAEKI
ncbi:MAG: 30S ribosomal protein S12 methylthiotransferase RimO [Spirochaetes bacterium]|nr:30S ribosomal protein S12 methylthiotransferase RimO [Spirochaetota bacterium]